MTQFRVSLTPKRSTGVDRPRKCRPVGLIRFPSKSYPSAVNQREDKPLLDDDFVHSQNLALKQSCRFFQEAHAPTPQGNGIGVAQFQMRENFYGKSP